MFDVDFLPVIVAAIVAYAAGALWYSPALFGKAWARLSGATMKKSGMAKNYVLGFIATLVMAYIFAHFLLSVVGAADYRTAFEFAFWVWLAFFAATQLGMVLWEGKSWRLYLINTVHYLVALLIIAAILIAWV